MPAIGASLGTKRAVAAAALLVGLGALLVVLGPDALFVAPAPAAALLLICRRYPGERLIVRLRRAPRAAAGRCPALLGTARAGHDVLPGGGLLLALSLAVRPPPRSAAA